MFGLLVTNLKATIQNPIMLTKHFPVATIFIIVLNGIIFAFGLLSGEQTHIIQNYGFIPNQIFYVQNEQQMH